MRCVITRVLPDPAPARMSSGPSLCCTASHCGGLSCACQAASITESSVPCALHTQVLPLPQQGLERGQFGMGIDTQNLLSIGHGDMRHTVVLGHRDRDHIREVLLALGVMPANAPQGGEEKGRPQTVDAAIDLMHRLFRVRGVTLFD